MASPARVEETLTLEEFLRMAGIDAGPRSGFHRIVEPPRRITRSADNQVLGRDPILPRKGLPVARILGRMKPWPDPVSTPPSPRSGSPIDGGTGR